MKGKIKRLALLQIVRRSAIAILVALSLIVWLQYNKTIKPLLTNSYFTQEQLNVTYYLFDLGVANINNDTWLDLYTTNHSARQSILINNSGKKFEDKFLQLNLTQNPEFPGVEPSDIEPTIITPGLYIYWDKAELVIRAKGINNLDSSIGEIQLPKSVAITKKDGLG